MKNHYKLWTLLSLIVVFAAGLISGILIDKYFLDKKPKKPSERAESQKRSSNRFPTLDMMAEELGLTAEQKEKIGEIFKNNEERFRALRKEMNDSLRSIRVQLNEEIKSVLTEEQLVKFEAMIERYVSLRQKESESRKQQSERHEKDKGEQR